MFENFVIFTEVVKLSSILYYNLEVINYSDGLAINILWKKDTIVFERLIDLVEDRRLVISKIIYILRYEVYAKYKYLDFLFRLITRNPELNMTAENECYYYVLSCIFGHFDFVKYLLREETEKDVKSQGLSIASEHGHLEIVKYLIQEGADVNHDYNFKTGGYPLRMATYNGYLKIVKHLTENNADLNLDDGYTLILSMLRNRLKISKYLIDNGSNLHSEENHPLKYAVEHNILEIVKYLVKKKVYTKQFLEEVSTIANNDSARYLVKQKMKY